jgi:hypothetical protein
MCYTDEGLIKQQAQDAADYYDGKKTGAQLGIFWNPTLPNPFPIEPMDNSSFCKCDACRALYEKSADETSPFFSTGRFSDYFFQFVNAVCRELQKTNPGAPIITLAYASHAQKPSFELDPHVIVEFCFACNRAPYDAAQYAHEEGLLKAWAQDKRDLYLWQYDTFPVESARNGKYHCFPGFFAHTIGEQFNLYKQLGVKGMFHCGYAQEVEAYVTFKLMDDPTLKVDDLLNDYFTGLYGPAGAPMKTMYLEMEKVFSDPSLRPKVEMSGATLSWGVLGTEARMNHWQGLLDQAKRLAQTDDQKARLAAFEHGTWSYMTAGREQYVTRSSAPIPSVTVPAVPAAGGDVSRVNWTAAAPMPGPWFDRGGATPTKRSYSARIAHDDKYLYLELTDNCDPKKLVASSMIFPYDDWEIFVAKQRALPYRQYAVGPSGMTVALSDGEENFRLNVPLTDSGWTAASDTTAPDKWVTRLAFPLATMLPGGVAPNGTVYMNVMRITSPAINGTPALGLDTWVSYCTVHEVDRLGELKLAP